MTMTNLLAKELAAQIRDGAEGPITIAICDAAGDLVLLDRSDGSAGFTADIAAAKAFTAARFGNSTSALEELWSKRPVYAHSLVAQGKWFVGRGGVPVRLDDQLIGAIGVSGSDPGEEEKLAERAAAGVGRAKT